MFQFQNELKGLVENSLISYLSHSSKPKTHRSDYKKVQAEDDRKMVSDIIFLTMWYQNVYEKKLVTAFNNLEFLSVRAFNPSAVKQSP